MFEHFTFGTSANAAGPRLEEGIGDEPRVAPTDRFSPSRDIPSTRHSSSSPMMAPSIDLDAHDSRLSSGIDNLVQRMSRQHLHMDEPVFLQPQTRLPSSPALSDRPSLPPCPELEMDSLSSPSSERPSLLDRRELSSLSLFIPPPSLGGSPDVEVMPDVAQPRTDTKRLRRQLSSQFNNNPVNVRAIHTLVEEMISTGAQCNVNTGPPPTPTSGLPLAPIAEPEPEPEPELRFACLELEVDDAYCKGNGDLTWMDHEAIMRRATLAGSGPGAEETVLRYRLSLDAALRCPNVVRSRPRMRKRKLIGNRPPSRTLSVASVASSVPPSPSLMSNMAS